MTHLVLDKTDNTPGVILDSANRLIEFTGDSRPENAKVFFEPIFNWITEYTNYLYFFGNESTNDITTEVNFKLEYFNSSSAKFFIEIIKACHKIENNSIKLKVTINWFYDQDDDDLLDAGKEFMKMTGIEMKFIPN